MYLLVFPKVVVPLDLPFLIGFSIVNHPFWGTPIFGNIHLLMVSQPIEVVVVFSPCTSAKNFALRSQILFPEKMERSVHEMLAQVVKGMYIKGDRGCKPNQKKLECLKKLMNNISEIVEIHHETFEIPEIPRQPRQKHSTFISYFSIFYCIHLNIAYTSSTRTSRGRKFPPYKKT